MTDSPTDIVYSDITITPDQQRFVRAALIMLQEYQESWMECNTFPISKTEVANLSPDAVEMNNYLVSIIQGLQTINFSLEPLRD